MEENNVVMENEELETETVPAEETYESNDGSTLVGLQEGSQAAWWQDQGHHRCSQG